MRARLPLAALAIIGLATPALAHSFLPEGGFYDRFIEGALVVLAYPATLLPLVAAGLLASLWHPDGLLRIWPVMIAGQAVGVGVAALVGTWVLPVMMGAGVTVATLAALLPSHSALIVYVAAAITGLLALAVSLEGHGLFELPLAIHLGIFVAANVAVALGAGLPGATLEGNDKAWVRIAWRVAASWIAAVLVLYLAFTLAG